MEKKRPKSALCRVLLRLHRKISDGQEKVDRKPWIFEVFICMKVVTSLGECFLSAPICIVRSWSRMSFSLAFK